MGETAAHLRQQTGRKRVPEMAIWAAAVVVAAVMLLLGRTGASWVEDASFIATGRDSGTPVYLSVEDRPTSEATLPPEALVVARTADEPEDWAYVDEVETESRSGRENALPWYGCYARQDELRVAGFDQIADYGVPTSETDGAHFRAGFTADYHAWFSRQGGTEWTALRMSYVRHRGPTLWVYRRGAEGRSIVEFSRSLRSHSLTMVMPRIEVIPAADGHGPPAIAHFDPSPTLALWKWDGSQYRPTFPRPDEVPTLLGLLVSAHLWWVFALLGFLAIWGVALRGLLSPATATLSFLIWAGTFLAFPVFAIINLSGIAVLYAREDIGFLRKALGTIVIGVVALALLLAAIPVLAD